jgi:hypothetical protein
MSGSDQPRQIHTKDAWALPVADVGETGKRPLSQGIEGDRKLSFASACEFYYIIRRLQSYRASVNSLSRASPVSLFLHFLP